MTEASAKSGGLALLAGAAVGLVVYERAQAAASENPPGPCVGLPPGATQSLAENVRNFLANAGQDVALDLLAGVDLATKLSSFGLVTSDYSADFYAWWNNLTPEQRAAVRLTEDGHLTCPIAETVQQAGVGGSALVSGALAGVFTYLVARELVED